MKIVVFCEGYTERAVVSEVLSRWLNARTTERIGLKPVRFNGWKQLVDDAPGKAVRHLQDEKVLGVVALLDLYGPNFYPDHCGDAVSRRLWAIKFMEAHVGNSRYRVHFAVHEVEAWILAQPKILNPKVVKKLPGKSVRPEDVNSNEPPAKLLDRLYNEVFKKNYKKVVDGKKLFLELDPEVVYDKCPSFKALADDLLELCPVAIRRLP